MIDTETLRSWTAEGESETLEFKKTTGQQTASARAVCAMLNHRSGRVVFGVTPKGELKGQDVGDGTVERLVAEYGQISPPAAPTIDVIALDDGKNAIVVQAEPGPRRPYMFHGKTYKRWGNTNKELDASEHNDMLLEQLHSTKRWENEEASDWSLAEQSDRVPTTEEDRARWRRENHFRLSYRDDLEPPEHKQVANGRLRLSLPSRWDGGRSTWGEGPRGPLEAKLASVFVELERRADEDDARAIAFARAAEERHKAKLVRLERQRQARLEQQRVERLRGEIDTWRFAAEVRAYVAALRDRLEEVDDEHRERLERWCDWAEAWAEAADPTINVSRGVGLEDERDLRELPFDLRPSATARH